MTPTLTRPKSLQPDADGFVRLDRTSAFAQILLHLSDDREAPTPVLRVMAALPQFTETTVRMGLSQLVDFGFAERVAHGKYVRLWGHIPGADA